MFLRALRKRVPGLGGSLLVFLAIMALAGCGVIRESVRIPSEAMSAVIPGTKSVPNDPAVLQADLQRYADEYASRTAAGVEEYARRVGTAAARSQALRWKTAMGSAAVAIASGPNPRANLLDFVVLSTINRTVIEEVWIPGTNGPAFQTWLHAGRALESNAWMLARGTLSTEQTEELRQAMRQWWEANPEARTGFLVRPEEFGGLIRQAREKDARPGSVFALVGLDPTAGLDPAVREVTRTRLFAERAMYAAQRAPFLLRWQIELLVDQLTRGPEVKTLLENTDRVGRAAETATTTMAELPDRIVTERKAILAALEEQEGKLRELSAEVGRTLGAGERMSTALQGTLVTFDALMKRFGVGEPATAPASEDKGEPFRILDYGETAGRLEAMANQLTGLLRTVDQTLGSTNLNQLTSHVGPVVEQAQTRGKELVDYAFWKGLILVGVAFLAAVIYRVLAVRMTQGRT